jgi:hypothetical protein
VGELLREELVGCRVAPARADDGVEVFRKRGVGGADRAALARAAAKEGDRLGVLAEARVRRAEAALERVLARRERAKVGRDRAERAVAQRRVRVQNGAAADPGEVPEAPGEPRDVDDRLDERRDERREVVGEPLGVARQSLVRVFHAAERGDGVEDRA